MNTILPGTSFMFVGKLKTMSREQARALVEARGGVCPSALSADLDYLVVGDEDSPFCGGEKRPKQQKAEALIEAGARIAVISEGEFLELLDAVVEGRRAYAGPAPASRRSNQSATRG